MNKTIADSVVKVAKEIFQTMVTIPLEAGSAHEESNSNIPFDLTGIIGLSGKNPGALGVRFPKRLAAKVAEKMLGTPVSETSLETRDVVGELTNMIAGGLKNELDKVNFHFEISIPTVIAGDQHTFTVMGDAPAIIIPFSSEGESFIVEVCFKGK